VLFSQLGWINTYLPLVVPKMLATDAFFIFLMVQFFRGIPRELTEAANIDGAGHGRIFFQIMLPLSMPALVTTAIFTFIWTWNDFFSQLIFLTDPDMYTVPVALRTFVDSQSESAWGALFADSVVSLLPVFLIFLFGQKYLVRGIATTGLK
jgi:multiple sugar transport system permease protein